VSVEEVLRDVIEQAEMATRRVRVNIVDSLPPVPVNRNALKLILLNVIENALKYSPEARWFASRQKCRAICAAAPTASSEAAHLRSRRRHSGRRLKRVFRPFVRLRQPRRRFRPRAHAGAQPGRHV
jgi:light-regulated signal transduction histidine kinase (bacteriophytochrome)